MADIEVDLAELPTASTLSGGEFLPMKQGAGAVKVTAAQLVKEALSVSSFPDAAALTGTETLPMQQGSGARKVTALRLVNEIMAAMGVYVDANGRLGIGTSTPNRQLHVANYGSAYATLENTSASSSALTFGAEGSRTVIASRVRDTDTSPVPLLFVIGAAEGARLDVNRNLLVGVTSGDTHTIAQGASQGDWVCNISGTQQGSTQFYSGANGNFNSAAAVQKVSANSVTGRSINAAGTINASGADYAEYVLKAWYCSALNPGAVCGINADGLLTDRFDDAHTFVIKSTNPAYVGNDTWAQAVGPRPERPALTLPEYTGPERPVDDDPDYAAKMAAWEAAQADHAAAVEAARSAHATAMQQYEADLADFEERLEAERIKWDRIAFSGQVPVNVQGAQPGQYIDAAPGPDGGIIGVPVDAPGPRTVGKVWKVLEDGRAWVAVMIR